MFVVATAGHVDHGKSTLVRALTGMEPDRWAEERTRGMTIDLGYAWTALPQGPTVAFVDVPGHERFIGNMLAGVGPAPAVMMVVSAEEGWRAQSAEHLAAIDALGLRHGLLVITRSDLADPGPATVQAQEQIAASSLGSVRTVAVSAVTGSGLAELRTALAAVGAELPAPRVEERVRLWVDRAFTIKGAGIVVTGTLAQGSLRVGDMLEFDGQPVRIRGLQSLGVATESVRAVSRVAINLKGGPAPDIRRGTPLVAPDRWAPTIAFDARFTQDTDELPTEVILHLGTGAFPVRIRRLGSRIGRIVLPMALPLQPGDRGILRNPGASRFVGAIEILDVEPPALRRRGSAARRASELAALDGFPSLASQVERRGAVRRSHLQRLGVDIGSHSDSRREGDWLISAARWRSWTAQLDRGLTAHDLQLPLQPGLSSGAAAQLIDLPDPALLAVLAAEAGLEMVRGRVLRPGSVPTLGVAEPGLQQLEKLLRANPFAAPERPDLQRWRLGRSELAAAEQAGRVLRLGDDVVLLPDAVERACEVLARLPAPFTTSQARAAMSTTRRVAIPLLEYLDRAGRTLQLQPGARVLTAPRH